MINSKGLAIIGGLRSAGVTFRPVFCVGAHQRDVRFLPATARTSIQHGHMTRYTVLPVDAAALKELRVLDDAGRPCAPYIATGDDVGSPLRCCLRPITLGERIAVASY